MPMFILLIIILICMTVFAVQNASPVTVSFFLLTFQASLAIVVLIALIAGIAIAFIVFSILRLKAAIRNKDRVSRRQPSERHEVTKQSNESPSPRT